MSHLQLKSDDCSPLGKLLLAYVEQHPDINLNKLAKEMGLSRPGLGWICLKHTSPNEETALKVAVVLGLEEREVARLVYANKLDNLADSVFLEKVSDLIDFIKSTTVLKRRETTSTRELLVKTAIQNMDQIFGVLRHLEESLYPENSRRSSFQLYKSAFEALKERLKETF